MGHPRGVSPISTGKHFVKSVGRLVGDNGFVMGARNKRIAAGGVAVAAAGLAAASAWSSSAESNAGLTGRSWTLASVTEPGSPSQDASGSGARIQLSGNNIEGSDGCAPFRGKLVEKAGARYSTDAVAMATVACLNPQAGKGASIEAMNALLGTENFSLASKDGRLVATTDDGWRLVFDRR